MPGSNSTSFWGSRLRNAWNGKGMTDEARDGLDMGWREWLDRYAHGRIGDSSDRSVRPGH